MPFKPGQSGNPAGRPLGARHKATLAVEALLEGQADELTKAAINKALEGDGAALRLCLDRICPPRKDRLVPFEMPKLESAADALKASQAIVAAVSIGELTPHEAVELSRLVESFAKTVETVDLESRLSAIEKSTALR